MCENDGLMVQWFLSSFGYTMYARTFYPEPDNRIQRHSHIIMHIWIENANATTTRSWLPEYKIKMNVIKLNGGQNCLFSLPVI